MGLNEDLGRLLSMKPAPKHQSSSLPACMMPDGAEACLSYTKLREVLSYFAHLDAMSPPEGVPLNEWLPAITGARAALRDR